MTDTPLKIGVLHDAWHENEDEVEPAEEEPPKRRRKRRPEKPDRDEVFEALTKRGHQPIHLCLDGRVKSLKSLAAADVDLIFNLTESYAGDDTKDINIAAYLDLLGFPYTGSGPSGLL